MRRLPLMALVATFGFACGEQVEPGPVYTVYGTVTSVRFDVSRKLAAVKLVAEGGTIMDPPLYSGSCIVQGPQCQYTILFVAEGSYHAFAMIDRNNNLDDQQLIPDSGDLVTGARPLMVWDKTQLDWPDSVWREQP